MKQILMWAARLTLLALTITSSLLAQRVTRRESHGEVRNSINAATVAAAIGNAASATSRLNGIGVLSADRILIVDARPYVVGSRRASYVGSLEKNRDDVERLRAELVTMDSVVRALAQRRPSLTIDAVVGVGIIPRTVTGKSSNVLVLYVDSSNQLGMSPAARRLLLTFRPTAAGVMSALYVSPEMVALVSALESIRMDRIRFYDIDAIFQTAGADSYAAAVERNNTAIRSLRAELSKRPQVMQALARHDSELLLGDIVAADIIADGDVLVLYYKRMTSVADSSGPGA